MNQNLKKITDASDICFSKSYNLGFSDYHVAKKAPRKCQLWIVLKDEIWTTTVKSPRTTRLCSLKYMIYDKCLINAKMTH